MDTKKPAKGSASASDPVGSEHSRKSENPEKKETASTTSTNSTSTNFGPLEALRSDLQSCLAALQEQPDTLTTVVQCLYHLDTLDLVLVPALRQAGIPEPDLQQSCVWHDLVRILLVDVGWAGPEDQGTEAKQAALVRLLEPLLSDEQGSPGSVFALIASHQPDLTTISLSGLEHIEPEDGDLTSLLDARRASLSERGTRQPVLDISLNILSFDALQPRGRSPSKEYSMTRNQYDRPRDDDGRFTSGSSGRGSSRDDDRYYESRSSYRSRRDDDDDDDRRYGRGGGSGDRPRDDQGRFMSDDDRGSSRRRYDDDDDDGRGWYGDPRGHSEAAHRGWEHRSDRGGYRSQRDDDDDRRYGRGGGSNDRPRDDQGRFMSDDDRGSSRRRYDDDDGRGWYGDPRGHSEAARLGWEHRSDRGSSRSRRDDDDDDRRYGRGGGSNDRPRDDQGRFMSDDDRRSSRGRRDDDDDDRRHGGWFGDSRGHSEAARRGQSRRG